MKEITSYMQLKLKEGSILTYCVSVMRCVTAQF